MLGPSGGDHVALRVQRRKHAEATDYWDGNWVDAEVSILIRPWRGEYDASLRAEEFVTFRQGLQRIHDVGTGEATFSTMEPWLELKLQLDPLGHISLTGEAGPEGFGRSLGRPASCSRCTTSSTSRTCLPSSSSSRPWRRSSRHRQVERLSAGDGGQAISVPVTW
jgi:hypothetical protein